MWKPMHPSQVSGNAADEIKQLLIHSLAAPKRMPIFAPHIHLGLVLSEVSIYPAPDEPLNQEVRVVLKIEVDECINVELGGRRHGGCIAYLIDYCSSLALSALRAAFLEDSSVGDKLRIVNTSIASQSKGPAPMAMSARAEIWEETRHRLLASGTHNLMKPSPRKLPSTKL
ncbi:hypothetical protein VNI00_014651 [Paramarasmius palmivorus]|uniref:Uncharacterized protein n=1 Tax=Paramarasmius palmivorus TaxID=297713 RepID=A0AAW0BRW9_9AGAR